MAARSMRIVMRMSMRRFMGMIMAGMIVSGV
jgi:hypothetical protein